MIGDDERLRQQQTLLTMTKRQVADRDARISTLQADLNAAVASCTESKRRAEAEGARAGEAEARADTAEKARTSATADVNRLRLTAANLEERLRAAEGKIGEAERERRRLEYELESGSLPFGSTTQDGKMTARVRDLETQVAAKDAELKQLRASQASTSASTSTPATDFYGAPVEPKRDSGSGVNNNIDSTRQLAELTAERDAEREFARASRAEAASLKARLDDAGRQRDKAMNDMLVAEKRAAKAREALEDTVADLRFELDARGGNTGLVEKVRDELRTERERADALAAAGQEKDARVAEKEAEVATLAAKVEEGAGVVVALNARIAVLEVGAIELASARESVVALTARVPELEAEIAAAGTARAALEERLVSATTEHATLAATLEEKAAALTTAEATRAALALQIAVLQPLTSELESARAALVAKDANAAALQSQLAAAGGVTTALAAKDAELASAHDVNSTLSRELAALEDALAGVHDELDSARARADEQARTLAAERDALAVAKAELIGAQRAHRNAEENGRLLRAEIERLVAEPQQGESSGGEVPALREQLAASTQAVNVLEGQVLTLQALAPAEPRKDVEKDMDTRFEQMTATIVRLRAERDDAASSLRFSEAERGFLLDGLRGEADATAAALVAKTEAHDALVAERAELVARVSELEVAVDAAKVSGSAELAAVIAARDAALARVSALEPQIAELERELDVTKAELAARDADLERERARRAEAEAHAAAMGGAAGADERAKLQIDELEGRVGRRNNEIKNLRTRTQELEFKLKSIKDDAAELFASNEEAGARVAELEAGLAAAKQDTEGVRADMQAKAAELAETQAALSALRGTHAEAEGAHAEMLARAENTAQELESAHAELAARASHVADLEAALSAARADAESIRGLVLTIAVQRRAVAGATAHARRAHVALADALEQAAALRKEQALLLAQGSVRSALAAELETARGELEEQRARTTHAEERIAALSSIEAELLSRLAAAEAARAEHAVTSANLSAALDATRANLAHAAAELAAARDEHVSAVADLRSAATAGEGEYAALAASADSARAGVVALEKRVREMEGEMAEKGAAVRAANAEAEKIAAELQSCKAELEGARSEGATARSELEDVRACLASAEDGQIASTAKIAALRADLATAHAELETAQQALQSTTTDLVSARAHADSLRGDLSAAQTDTTAVRAGAESLEAQLAAVQEEITSVTTERDTALSDTASGRAALATAEGELAAVRSDLASVRQQLESTRADLEAAEKESAAHGSTTTELAEARAKLERLWAMQAEDGARLAALEKELGDAVERAESLAEELSGVQAAKSASEGKVAEMVAAEEGLREEVQSVCELLAEKEVALASLSAEVEASKASTSTSDAEEVAALRASLEAVEVRNIELSSQISTLRHAQTAPSASTNTSADTTVLEQQNAELQQQLSDAQDDLARANDSLTSKLAELDEADDRALELTKEIKRLKKRAEKVERAHRAAVAELEAAKASAKAAGAALAAVPAPAPAPAAAAATPRSTSATAATRSPGSLKRRREDREDDEAANTAPEVRVQAGPLKARVLDENAPAPALTHKSRTSLTKSGKTPASVERRKPALAAKTVFAQDAM